MSLLELQHVPAACFRIFLLVSVNIAVEYLVGVLRYATDGKCRAFSKGACRGKRAAVTNGKCKKVEWRKEEEPCF